MRVLHNTHVLKISIYWGLQWAVYIATHSIYTYTREALEYGIQVWTQFTYSARK